MTKHQKELNKLREAFQDVIWMAVRYANGSQSYSPGMVRDAVAAVREVFPDFELKYDSTLMRPDDDLPDYRKQDYLHDLLPKQP